MARYKVPENRAVLASMRDLRKASPAVVVRAVLN
jgi:hypothetical protein